MNEQCILSHLSFIYKFYESVVYDTVFEDLYPLEFIPIR
jgi:hypothetical protein